MGESDEPTTYENASEIKSTGQTKARSRLFIISLAFAIIFLATTCVFLALFVYSHVNNAVRASTSKTAFSQPDLVSPGPSAPPQDAVCNTTDCVVTAARMISKMNISADPCVDFNEFACGRFISETLLPDGKEKWGTFAILNQEHKMLMKGIITEETKHGQPEILSKMRDLYMRCMDEVEWEQGVLTSYKRLELAKDWPTTNQNWTGDNLPLPALIDKYVEHFFLLYSIKVNKDEKNSSKMAIKIGLPVLGLPRDYFILPRNDPVIMAYEKYLTAYARAAGASLDTASQDAKDVVNLEIELSKITPPKEETQDDRSQYNPKTFKELSNLYPELELFRSMQHIYDRPRMKLQTRLARNTSLTDDDTMIIQFPSYMGNISSVIKRFSNRILQNLFGFKFAISRLLTREMRSIKMALDKVLLGKTGHGPRWEPCVMKVAEDFPKEMETLFKAKSPKDGYKSDVIELINTIKKTFKQMVVENTWMSQSTKQEVYNKLLAIRPNTENLNDDAAAEESIVEITKKVAIPKGDNVAVKPVTEESDPTEEFNSILWKHITTSRFNPEGQVSAEFMFSDNIIRIESGIVHPPFFSRKSQNYLNYGALGMVFSHEIGHGFDTRGIHYDDKGNLRDWWTKSDMDTFQQRVQCLVNQTSGFYQDEIKMQVSGVYTRAEAIADHIGLKTSYRAYKELVRKNGEDPRLPNMNYTPDQLFFLSFSQLWCVKETKESMVYDTKTSLYIPNKYRTITALQNSEGFAKAYNCPRGSHMNPEKKCDVW